MSPVLLQADLHEVREIPVAAYLRRRLHDDDIVTYRYKQSGAWAVGSWWSRTGGTVIEYELIGTDPATITRGIIDNILWERSPKKLEWVKQLRGAIYSRYRKSLCDAQDQADYHVGIREFLQRRATIHRRDHPDWAAL